MKIYRLSIALEISIAVTTRCHILTPSMTICGMGFQMSKENRLGALVLCIEHMTWLCSKIYRALHEARCTMLDINSKK